jgi:1-acyl-sn-glycerol-3-phosphate acyltransferase
MTPWQRMFNAFASFVVCQFFFRLVGWRRVLGRHRVPKSGPVLFAANHMSYLDPPLVGGCSPRRLRPMAKAELFEKPFMNWLMHGLGVFPVRRGSGDREAIKFALECLERGECIMLFPEGTRGPGDGHLLPFQSGVAMLARRTGCVVVPVGISGTQRVLPKGGGFRWGRIGLCFGEPMRYEDFGPDFTAELARRISACTAELGAPQLPAEIPAIQD